MISWLIPTHSKRVLFFVFADGISSVLTLYIAYLLRFNFDIPEGFLDRFWFIAVIIIGLKTISIAIFKNYTIVWRFFGFDDMRGLFWAHVATYAIFTLLFVMFPLEFNPFPRSVIVIDFFLSFFMLGTIRFLKRLILESSGRSDASITSIIVGASSQSGILIKSLLQGEYYPLALFTVLEKNHNMAGLSIHGVPVYKFSQLKEFLEKHPAQVAILEGSLPADDLKYIYDMLGNTTIKHIRRSVVLGGSTAIIEPLCVEDLLARHPKDLDADIIGAFIKDKIVLITGAGGSIGSEIALQCHYFGASKLILVDHSEYNLYQISEQLPSAIANLSNIIDEESFSLLLKTHTPDIVIHAAAYKHVPLCEANISAAVLNNIQGSRNVIDCAIAHGVPKIVIISTDKAVRPTNVMGATKRIVELYAQNVDSKKSEIVAVRFGNVLGSSGSVIPKFKAQIEAGGPITLTHPDITRYFMLIGEACQLVLQAAAIARGGELFILDMGEPIKIIDLARTMIRLYAKTPIAIETIGLRAGEKLYEELLIDESEQKTRFESIMIAGSSLHPIDQLNHHIDALLETNNPIASLVQIVPEFTPQG